MRTMEKCRAVFAGETALLGKDEIEEKLPELLEKGEAPYAKMEEKLENLGEGRGCYCGKPCNSFWSRSSGRL